MFKYANASDEILQSMQHRLARQNDVEQGLNKLAQALDLLNAAADLFDQSDLPDAAQETTQILRDVAQQLGAK